MRCRLPLGPASGGARLTERSGEEVAWRHPPARRVRAVRDRLRLVYGQIPAVPGGHGHPIAELVLTVLSQSTNDRNRDVAYLRLRESWSDWEEVRDAPVDEIEAAIRPGGISRVKSARIKDILAAITASSPDGELGLDWLAEHSVAEAQQYLCALPGVGRKTAACVLLFALGMRDVPGGHPRRRAWATRLGLFRAGAPFLEMHDTMLALTPPGEELELHMNLLARRRRTRHAVAWPPLGLRAGADVPECGLF